MNISYRWLKDLVEFDLTPEILAEKLTAAGLAVEGIEEKNDDFIFDIDLTSNRSDCLSHLGVAREICAFDQSSKIKEISAQNPASEIQNGLVTIQDPDLCPRFTARIIRNVKIAESPDWLKKRLASMGERPINNIADITNYVMLELGQPMHAFDLNKLTEQRIVVRRARTGERIKTLDEVERRLDEKMLAICDAEKPVAVGGVMGGFESAITDQTTDVLLEVAYFKRSSIRRTSQALNLATEASYRFERGVDIENLIRASNRATDLIIDLAGGEAEDFIDVYPTKFFPFKIESADIQSAVKRLTGLTVEKPEILRIFTALGIETVENNQAQEGKNQIFLSPSWRHDIAIEEDLVEEVARIVGYDRLESLIPPSTQAGEYQPNEMRKFYLRQTLANLGFDEALSYSFIDTKHDDSFEHIPDFLHQDLEEKFVTIKDPIIEGSTRMRPSLLPGLLDAVRLNFNHQRRDLKLFEIGKVFAASEKEDGLPDERELFSLVLTGNETFENKALQIRPMDFFDAKGALESAADALNIPDFHFSAKDFKHLRTGQSAEVLLKDRPVGIIGRLSEDLSDRYKFKQPVYLAELDLQAILAEEEKAVFYRPLPVYPSIVRDVSILINRSNSLAEIISAIRDLKYELLSRIHFVDVFEGKGIAGDERSVTIRLEYRSDQRTLLEDEIETVHRKILDHLAAHFGARQKI